MEKFNVMAVAIAAGVLVSGQAMAHSAYNMDGYANTNSGPVTGHSLSGADGNNPSATPAILLGANPGDAATARWTASGPGAGYTGALPGMWLAAFHGYTTYNLSTADGLSKTWNHDSDTSTPNVAFGATHSGFELAVGAKSWEDTAGQGADTGWGHALDFGFISLDLAGHLTVTVSADGSGLLPAFSLYQGYATEGLRHDAYVNNENNPLSTDNLELLAAVGNDLGAASVTQTFQNLAAGKYMLFVGGDDGATGGRYNASLALAPVPIPGAVWLFGSAAAGLFGFCRRKSIAA